MTIFSLCLPQEVEAEVGEAAGVARAMTSGVDGKGDPATTGTSMTAECVGAEEGASGGTEATRGALTDPAAMADGTADGTADGMAGDQAAMTVDHAGTAVALLHRSLENPHLVSTIQYNNTLFILTSEI